jgi:hypothetical protein
MHFDRHAKTFATDARWYVGWGRRSLKFQHITLIQEIPATTLFKTSTTLNDGQQQPVHNFAPRDNLKCFFKDGVISSGASEVKEAAGRYFCWGEAHAWVYQTSWELQIVSIRENSGLHSFDFEFWGGGPPPPPPPRHNKCTFPYRHRLRRSNLRQSLQQTCMQSVQSSTFWIKNLEATTFLPCLKRLMARRGRPRIIYSDNGAAFVFFIESHISLLYQNYHHT